MSIQVDPKPKKSWAALVVLAVIMSVGLVFALAPLALPFVLIVGAVIAVAWWFLDK